MGMHLAKTSTVKDLGNHVAADISWKQHIEEKMKKKQIKFCTCLIEMLQLS